MAQALYRKYRSKSFDEVIGQEHITDTLLSAVKSGKLSHAYLFTGPHGVGKTSTARILAHIVNDLPYDDESIHLDIIEIDAASNNGVEDIRDLRDKVHVLPTSGKYKVYIVDEAHMLSKAAFNALLKTLEEPPKHVIFILATTEAHKLPETIISRTQRYTFRPADVEAVSKHLANIAKKEKIKAEPEALRLLAEHGHGSFRDSVSLLDQLHTTGQEITADMVRDKLGLPPGGLVDELVAVVLSGDTQACLKHLRDLKVSGVSAATIAKEVSGLLRQKLADGEVDASISGLLGELIEVPASPAPQDRLEVSLLSASSVRSPSESKAPAEAKAEAKPEPKAKEAKPEPQEDTDFHAKIEPAPAKPIAKPKVDRILTDHDWQQILSAVKKSNSALGIALKHAAAQFEPGNLNLIFEFALYKNKAGAPDARKLIADKTRELYGLDVKVECLVDKPTYQKLVKERQAAEKAKLQTINNIFGGGEVLESQ